MEDDDDRDFTCLDLAKLSPLTCVLEQSDPDAEKLPRQFQVGGDDLYAETAVF
jgi:hypothetical protein